MRKLILKENFNLDFIKRMIRWHMRYYVKHQGMPLISGVYITDGCNCHCIMCNIWKNKNPSVYPFDAQKRAVDALARVGCYYYSVSGGEPTLVQDLPERLAYTARKIPYVHVVTNGLTMTRELARKLGESGIKEISISIDGVEEFHNILRGLSTAFERAWNALDLICTHAPKIKVVINSILTPYNIASLKELCKRLDAFPHVYLKYLPLSFHELLRNQDRTSLPFRGAPASLSDIENFLNGACSNPKVVNSRTFLKKAIRFFQNSSDVIAEQKRCNYPYFGIEFDAKGFAYPCITGSRFQNGLSPDADLETYLRSKEYVNVQRELEGCKKCRGSMMLCYYEPRLNFPLNKLLYYNIFRNY